MNWKMKRELSYKISFSEFKASLTTNKLDKAAVTNNCSNMNHMLLFSLYVIFQKTSMMKA